MLNDPGFEFRLPPVLSAAENRALLTPLYIETLVVRLRADGLTINLSFALKMHSL